ncbi:hypothetical protein [Nocardioides convexus]|uniref:hypothetical protein n=1 Tax=Nocardioides convexus TaxID=2712224 RepID=UPI0024188326|nr:hypothetical protein [Nocardioides convexus]
MESQSPESPDPHLGRRPCRARRVRERACRRRAAHGRGRGPDRHDQGRAARDRADAGEPRASTTTTAACVASGGSATAARSSLSGGRSVFEQPSGTGRQYPFPLGSGPKNGTHDPQCVGDLPHGWSDQHAAWNAGKARCVGLRQGRRHPGLPDSRRPAVLLRPRRRLHDLRRLPLLRAVLDRTEPALPLLRHDRRGPQWRHLQQRRRLPRQEPHVEDLRRVAGDRRHRLEGLPGQRQLRRQRVAVLQGVLPRHRHQHRREEEGQQQGPLRLGQHRLRHRRRGQGGRARRDAAAGLVDRHRPVQLRAPDRSDAQRRVAGEQPAHRAERRPGRPRLHRALRQLRRERRLLRPRPAAGAVRRSDRRVRER